MHSIVSGAGGVKPRARDIHGPFRSSLGCVNEGVPHLFGFVALFDAVLEVAVGLFYHLLHLAHQLLLLLLLRYDHLLHHFPMVLSLHLLLQLLL